MPKKANYSSCEIPIESARKADGCNRHYRFQEGFTWKGVRVRNYKTKGDDWSGIIRQVLIGERGEAVRFHLRYFEISPGGYSSFETHRHTHVVIGIRGRGMARLNRRTVEINFLDVLYINSHTPHKLYNPYSEPFGFFCIVDAKRDKPRLVKGK